MQIYHSIWHETCKRKLVSAWQVKDEDKGLIWEKKIRNKDKCTFCPKILSNCNNKYLNPFIEVNGLFSKQLQGV